MDSKQDLKQTIYDHCKERVMQMIDTAAQSLQSAEEAAQNETKSSVGDKFETGRAMAHAEMHKAKRQLGEAKVLLAELKQLKNLKESKLIDRGSLIKTNKGIFYLSIGLGKITIDNQKIFVLGVQSPIGRLLLHKKPKDKFSFNGIHYVIEEVN